MSNTERTADLIASIGVNTHINETSGSYTTSDVEGQMAYLGIVNMRTSTPYDNLGVYTALGQAGIRFDIIPVIAHQNPVNLAAEMAQLDSIAPYVQSVEGPNEINTNPINYAGLSGAAAADALQKDLYNAVQADPRLQGVGVLPFSLSVGGSIAGYGNVAAYANEGNVHGYASQGVPPYYMLGYAVSSVTTTPGLPTVVTETGYYTLNDGNSGVNQYVQSVWLMDSLLEDSANGVLQTYIYQLEDNGSSSTDPEENYGLFTAAGTPKQSATDLHNLTTILADPGASASTFTPGTLNYAITGLSPDYGFSKLYAKSNGSFDLALWSEPNFYSSQTGQSAVTPSSVTVALGGSYNVSVYDPVQGTSAIATYKGVTSVTVALGTDPLIIETSSVATASATSSSVAASVIPAPVLGSGPDTIIVNLSEDAYLGDASASITVDGQQIGGNQQVVASHAAGATESFALNGNFGAGPHTIGVTFLNDAYGNSASTDRNLYVDSVTTGGTTTAVNTELSTNGSTSFQADISTATIQGPTPLTIAFIASSGAVTQDAGSSGNQTLTAGTARTDFVLHAGAANGDTITNFDPSVANGDFLQLAGYGTGATLTQVTANSWQASNASGSVQDVIHLTNGAGLVPGVVVFS